MQHCDKIRWHLSNVPTAFVWASINWTSWQMCPKYWLDFLISVEMAKTPQQQYNVDWKFLRRLWFRFMSMLLAVLVSCGPIRAPPPPPCSHCCSQETQLKFNSRLPSNDYWERCSIINLNRRSCFRLFLLDVHIVPPFPVIKYWIVWLLGNIFAIGWLVRWVPRESKDLKVAGCCRSEQQPAARQESAKSGSSAGRSQHPRPPWSRSRPWSQFLFRFLVLVSVFVSISVLVSVSVSVSVSASAIGSISVSESVLILVTVSVSFSVSSTVSVQV